jgi:hypothetical protein
MAELQKLVWFSPGGEVKKRIETNDEEQLRGRAIVAL